MKIKVVRCTFRGYNSAILFYISSQWSQLETGRIDWVGHLLETDLEINPGTSSLNLRHIVPDKKLYKARTLTKDRNYRGVFINEHLTKARSELLYEARRRVKSKQLKSAWSSDGTILIKFSNETVARISDKNELPELIQLPDQ